MNDPESLGDNLEELQQSLPAQDVDQNEIDAVPMDLPGGVDILFNYDEEDEPRLRATGELEMPSPEDCLDAYQAVMLYNFLCSQANTPQLVFKPTDGNPPHLYDWFVNSLNICPLGNLLDELIKRLLAWKRLTSNSGAEPDNEELDEMGIHDSIEWTEFPGLRA